MTYPGDASLSPEIQQRISTTYRQTLQLASQGKRQEALLGCDFILRLDSQFGPARALQQMIQSGSPTETFVEMLAAVPEAASRPAQAPQFEGLTELRLEVADAAPPSAAPDLAARLEELLAARRFQELVAIADGERRSVAANPALRQLVETARARMEADPYVLGFVDPARQALQAGEFDEFERLMRKARALDSSHPALAELDEAKAHYQDPERVLGRRRRPGAAVDAPGEEVPLDQELELPDLDFSEPAPAAGDGFDLGVDGSGGAAAGEGTGRIAELLREGESAFGRGEFQAAIDAWSRIFLIDIDHQEAARRIEQARQLKAEREREVEEHFHDAVERFDRGEYDAARDGFERVLSMHPGYVLAQEYLEKIEERLRGGPVVSAAAEPAPASAPPGAPPPPPRTAAREELSEEILVPPEPGQAAPARRGTAPAGAAVAARRKGGLSFRFLVIGGAVLALLAAAGWFVSSRWDRLFPNAMPVATPAPAQADPIARAKKLQEEGKSAVAIAQLRRIPPDDPRYGEAQSLVSQWEAIGKESSEETPALTTAQVLRRRALIDGARADFANQLNVRARTQLERAGEIAPLAGEEAELAASVQERLAPFGNELQLFKDGEYEFLLNALWRRREAEKGNRDLDQLLVNAYYNLAVLDLQRGDPASAVDKLREARKVDAGDPKLERLARFAATYERRSEDLLYRIFVKYLQLR